MVVRGRRGIVTELLRRRHIVIGQTFEALSANLVAWAGLCFWPDPKWLLGLLDAFVVRSTTSVLIGAPWSLVAFALLHRSEMRWQSTSYLGAQDDPGNQHQWKHHRRGPHRRWERPFAKVLGLDWTGLALDRHAWRVGIERFIDG